MDNVTHSLAGWALGQAAIESPDATVAGAPSELFLRRELLSLSRETVIDLCVDRP